MSKVKYRCKKFNSIDGFFVLRLTTHDTKLPYDILLNSLGKHDRIKKSPQISVIVNKNVIPILISDEQIIISGDVFPYEDIIIKWIEKHKTVLILHWNKEITDRKVLELLSTTNSQKFERNVYE